jgi:hypothetical protein
LTENGVVVGEKEYGVDVLIFSTGFSSPSAGGPAFRSGMSIIGRNGHSLDDKWVQGAGTLHGLISSDFPNLFLSGPSQMGVSSNQAFSLDQFAIHAAYIVAEAHRKSAESAEKIIIEPTKEAEEDWSMRVMSGAVAMAALAGCTPSYLTAEAEIDRPLPVEQQMAGARGVPWTQGSTDYVRIIEAWRKAGGLEGLKITV